MSNPGLPKTWLGRTVSIPYAWWPLRLGVALERVGLLSRVVERKIGFTGKFGSEKMGYYEKKL
jgi:hypothetical protein